jgi:hypothetical protein
MSNIRAEIVGIDLIQEYCRTNSIQKISDMTSNIMDKLAFTKKSSTKDDKDNWQKPIDMFDMNFRVSYQLEQKYNIQVPFIKSVVNTWSDRKKTFRLLNRTRFEHPDFPVFADLSIIRSSKKFAGRGNRPSSVQIPTYTLQESGVMEAAETYEIELEIVSPTIVNDKNELYNIVHKVDDILKLLV